MKILIIEDEPKATEVLIELIGEVCPSAQIVMTTESIAQTVQYLNSSDKLPDVAFVDIHLADGVSFEIFNRATLNCPLVFCTAYDQYTMEAFKTNAISYILKPVKLEDIKHVFEKMERLKQSFMPHPHQLTSLGAMLAHKKPHKGTLLLRIKDSYVPVPTQSIAFFIVETGVVYAYRTDGQRTAVYKTLDELSDVLDPDIFFRVNRQCLINRHAISELHPYFNRKMVVKTHIRSLDKIVISRLKVSDFLYWLEKGSF